jgi:hypothetical protein
MLDSQRYGFPRLGRGKTIFVQTTGWCTWRALQLIMYCALLVLGRRLARLETRSFSDSLYDRLGSLILRPSNIGTDPFITGLSPLLTALPVGYTNPIRLELIHFSRGHQQDLVATERICEYKLIFSSRGISIFCKLVPK